MLFRSLIYALKSIAESEVQDAVTQTSIAQDLKAKIVQATGLDKAQVLADDEIQLLAGKTPREIEAAVIAKINANIDA